MERPRTRLNGPTALVLVSPDRRPCWHATESRPAVGNLWTSGPRSRPIRQASGMAVLEEPVTRELRAVLRRAVLDLRVSQRGPRFDPVLHVGSPVDRATSFDAPVRDLSDHALRADIVSAMLRRVTTPPRAPMVWLTRPGELDLQDVDAAWLAAARTAYAEAAAPLTMVVVTRGGWRDPRSGVRTEWKRLR